MMRHLYVVGTDSQHTFYIHGKNKCDICDMPLQKTAFHYYNPRFMGKKDPREVVLCGMCAKDLPGEMKVPFGQPEIKLGIVVPTLPKGAYPILVPTTIVYTKSLGDAMNDASIRTVDHCKRAGRAGYTFDNTLQIGKSEEQLEIDQEKKNAMIAEEGFEEYLLSFTPTSMLEYEQQDLLEDQSEEHDD